MAGGKRGWDLFWQAAPTRRPAAAAKKKDGEGAAAGQVIDENDENRPEPEGFLVANLINEDKKSAISVRSKRRISQRPAGPGGWSVR